MTTTWTPARILALRRTLGLSQAELATRLGVAVLAVSRWERGVHAPSSLGRSALDRLARRHSQPGHGIAPAALPFDSNRSDT